MKHIFTILLLLCSFNFAFADNEVDMKVIESTGTMPRSLVQKPRVQLERDLCQLTIAFSSQDLYTLSVVDDKGFIVHQESLMTDGSGHVYDLPTLDEGFYTISVESDNRSFVGEFNI